MRPAHASPNNVSPGGDIAATVPVRQRFGTSLDDVRNDLVTMGATAEEMLRDAVDSLTRQDAVLAASVLKRDDEVDRLDREVEERTLRLLALQQPVVARDLRFVALALKASTDLERIGDHCVNVAKVGVRIGRDGLLFQLDVDIPRLGGIAADMLHDTVEALVQQDVERAHLVIASDDQLDVLYAEASRQLRERMLSGEAGPPVVRASYLLFIAHYLERIGDHCVGIAERLIYAETGQSVSHGKE